MNGVFWGEYFRELLAEATEGDCFSIRKEFIMAEVKKTTAKVIDKKAPVKEESKKVEEVNAEVKEEPKS